MTESKMRCVSSVFVVLLSLLCGACASQKSSRPETQRARSVSGTYEKCLMACTTILLRDDFTFDIVLTGDLWSGQRAAGRWFFDDDGDIVFKGSAQPHVEEKNLGLDGEIQFRILDQNRNPVEFADGGLRCPEETGQWTLMGGQFMYAPAASRQNRNDEDVEQLAGLLAEVSPDVSRLAPMAMDVPNPVADAPGNAARMRMDEDRTIHVSQCSPSWFFVELYTPLNLVYVPKNPDADDFTFVFDQSTDFYVQREVYRFKQGGLFEQIQSSGDEPNRWSDYPFERVSRRILDPDVAWSHAHEKRRLKTERADRKRRKKASKIGRVVIDALTRHFTVSEVDIWQGASIDLCGHYFHARIRRSDLPENLCVLMDLKIVDGKVATSDSMVKRINDLFNRIMSIGWLERHLQEHPDETLEIRYMDHRTMSETAIESFSRDAQAWGEDCGSSLDHDVLQAGTLLEIDGNESSPDGSGRRMYRSLWILLPDGWTILWEMNGSDLLGMSPQEFPDSHCFFSVSPEGELAAGLPDTATN